jgi:polysaccharide biosynthesis/export protein
MKKNPSSGYRIISIIILSLLLSSCISMKRMKYLQPAGEKGTQNAQVFNTPNDKYKVQPGDNLYIRVSTLDEKTNSLFNIATGGSAYGQQATSDLSVYLASYTVSDSGFITFPLAGKIQVAGNDEEKIEILVQQAVDKYLRDTKVIVKLINNKISVLGEVRKPGQFVVYQNGISIFEVIALAGDMNNYANRNQVQLIRKTGKGNEIHYLDLTSKNIISSPYYMLKPNDIVYVAPLNSRNFATEQFPYALIFGIISSTLLLLTYFK